MGISEIADLTGLSRQAVSNLKARDDRFPTPVADLRSGPVYDETAIRVFFSNRGRDLEPSHDRPTVRRFDPLALDSLIDSVSRELLTQARHRLDMPFDVFQGAGLVVLYYTGSFEPYSAVSGTDVPLYIGAAGSRDAVSEGDVEAPVLWTLLSRRIMRDLEAVEHHGRESGHPQLRVADFECRLLVVDGLWVDVVQKSIIRRMKPLWNTVLMGFNSHGSTWRRALSPRSPWDEFHPGRRSASDRPAKYSAAELTSRVRLHLEEVTKHL
ncbi:Eco29kI family restriction endonuclease [Saccharothrix sp. NPDC042600]|uniref:Eco29kI family restriction endonuclease n=1 Tax=Saccharothrix TaxID=2071 RepID=UPI0033EDE920